MHCITRGEKKLWYQMFVKYGEFYPNTSDSPPGPDYIVNENYDAFIETFYNKYLMNYPNIQPEYKTLIDSVVADANGVSVK